MQAKRVLIADDDQALTTALRIRCESLGLEVETAANGVQAVARIHDNPPDLVILDVTMPAGGGLSVCQMLADVSTLEPIPVIILTGRSDPETIQRCEALGAHYVLKGVDALDKLLPIVRSLLGFPESQDTIVMPTDVSTNPPPDPERKPTILSVDDDPDISRALRLRLGSYGINVLRAFNGMQGYWMALRERPDVIITDFRMPEGRGNMLLGRLKSHSLTKDIPVLILSGGTMKGQKDHALEREMRSLGAAKFFRKPLDFDALLMELEKHIPIQHPAPIMALGVCPDGTESTTGQDDPTTGS